MFHVLLQYIPNCVRNPQGPYYSSNCTFLCSLFLTRTVMVSAITYRIQQLGDYMPMPIKQSAPYSNKRYCICQPLTPKNVRSTQNHTKTRNSIFWCVSVSLATLFSQIPVKKEVRLVSCRGYILYQSAHTLVRVCGCGCEREREAAAHTYCIIHFLFSLSLKKERDFVQTPSTQTNSLLWKFSLCYILLFSNFSETVNIY